MGFKVAVCISWMKWNLPHTNNNDVRTTTLSIRGISFQFRLAMKSFFVTQSARFICVSVLFPIQITKHELIYVCFLNFDCTYLYKIKTVKERDFVSRIALIPKVVSQIIFSSLWASEISAFFIFRGVFNKPIIPFALVGYEIGYSQLGPTGLVGYLPSHIQRALMK